MTDDDPAKSHESGTQMAPSGRAALPAHKASNKKEGKDFWEKFSSMSTFLSTVLVALAGGYFTYSFNAREAIHQHSIQETQTVAQLMPYLTSKDEKQQRTALIAVKLLQDAPLMVNLAASDPMSPGSRQALREVAYSAADQKDRSVAADALRQFEFVPACPLPFRELVDRPIDQSLDQSCGMFGFSDSEAQRAENFAKNNFCAAGPIQAVTIADLANLQGKVQQNSDIPFGNARNHPLTANPGPAGDRKHLQAIGEGKQVVLKGFILIARLEGAESVNCGRNIPDTPDNHDIHVSIVESPGQDECSSIVAEMSPHHRPVSWTAQNVNTIASRRLLVRVTGQLFFDSTHTPCQSGSTVPGDPRRASLWEIHPIYEFDVCSKDDCTGGKGWLSLDDFFKG